MKYLVTGGAGYLGSHTSQALLKAGHEVLVYDNLSTGFSEALHKGVKFHMGDVRDATLLTRILKDTKIDGVFHFAGKLKVSESLVDPLSYYEHNVQGLHSVVKAMLANNVQDLVFASTAAVYGDPKTEQAFREEDPKSPVNPYGHSKLMCEQILADANRAHGLSSTSLRYFNVAGASLDGLNGQRTHPAYHLIHVAAQAACGLRSEMQIYGADYPTKDGTCIRDFIHVEDLTEVNCLAMQNLQRTPGCQQLNVGYGEGASVRQVIQIMKKVSGVDFKVKEIERRPGEPSRLVADPSKMKALFGWTPRHHNLEKICLSAFEWEKKFTARQSRNL
ncbi:MAG: UDP-glucose 4-epimerase GalE [Bdellovibrionales bacterium]